MPTHTTLKGFTQIGDCGISDNLEANLMSFFQWGMLGVGGFFNVNIPKPGPYGGNYHRFRLSEDENYTKGQVWEAARKDFVWEQNIEYDEQPIAISGVYVNGTFHSSSETGTYKHKFDYPNGRVIFDSPISGNSVVTAEYSHRYVNFTTSDAPWWREVQFDSFRVDSPDFLQYGSGQWSTHAQTRVQLPTVVVEAVPRTTRKPYQVGDSSATVRQDVLFHVLAETRSDCKKLHDIITCQWKKRLQGFDKNAILQANAFPLDADGAPVSGAKMYPQLVQDYFWTQLRIENMSSSDSNIKSNGQLYYATVRGTIELDTA